MTVKMSTNMENRLTELTCDTKFKHMFIETYPEMLAVDLCTENYSKLSA